MAKSISRTGRATKDLLRIEPVARRRLLDAVYRYARTGHGDVKPLAGSPGIFRLRVGDYRLTFTDDDESLVVLWAGHRKDAYRG